jgi:hypothetical protein
LASHLLTFKFLRQFTFKPFLFSGFQKKGVPLHLLNNAFLLDLSLETAKRALNGFSVENPDFCQNVPPVKICDRSVSMSGYCAESNAYFFQMPAVIIYQKGSSSIASFESPRA